MSVKVTNAKQKTPYESLDISIQLNVLVEMISLITKAMDEI